MQEQGDQDRAVRGRISELAWTTSHIAIGLVTPPVGVVLNVVARTERMSMDR